MPTTIETRHIAIDQIKDFHDNVRHEELDSHVATLATDIAANGLLHPITVRRVANNQYEVVAGRRRLTACRSLDHASIPAVVVDVSDRDGFLLSLSENMHRHPMTNKDRCMAIKRCYAECNQNLTEVMAQTHLAETTVRRYLEIAQLPADTIDRLDAQGDDRLTLQEAYQMTRPPLALEPALEPVLAPEEDKPKKPKKKPLKSEPWVYDEDGAAVAIPESLYTAVYQLIRQS
jgi:ParB/RepB/Spo0J family partition protein